MSRPSTSSARTAKSSAPTTARTRAGSRPGEYEFSYGREATNSVVNGPENGVFRATYEVGLTLTPGGANPIPPATGCVARDHHHGRRGHGHVAPPPPAVETAVIR